MKHKLIFLILVLTFTLAQISGAFPAETGCAFALRRVLNTEFHLVGGQGCLRPMAAGEKEEIELLLIENIRSALHDLNNYFTALLGDSDLIASKVKRENIKQLCNNISQLINKLKPSLLGIVKGTGDLERNLEATKKASMELMKLLSGENILILQEEYKNLYGDIPRLEAICETIKLILASGLDLSLEELTRHGIEGLLDIALVLEASSDIEINKNYGLENQYLGINEPDIFRVFLNIILNAKDAQSKRISVQTKTEANTAIITIKDDGPGMPQDKAEAFNSGRSVISSKGEGRGLGLRIVRRLVEKNSGAITIYSRLGEGSVFTISLPIAAGQRIRDVAPSGRGSASQRGRSQFIETNI